MAQQTSPTLSPHSDPPAVLAGPACGRLTPAALRSLASARRHLHEAGQSSDPTLCYINSHMAALRAAAAVLAQRTAASGRLRSRRPRSVWELLPDVAPELTAWVSVFAASAQKRAAAEANLPPAVTASEAEDLLGEAGAFLALVQEALAGRAADPGSGAGR